MSAKRAAAFDTNKSRRFAIGTRRTYKGWAFRYPSGQIFKTLSRGTADQYPDYSVMAIHQAGEAGQVELPLKLSQKNGWATYEPPTVIPAEPEVAEPEVEPALQGCVGQPCGGSQIGG